MAATVKKVEMTKAKDCKGSVKYETSDASAVVTNVYVDRKFQAEMPDKVVVTIEAGK